VLPSGSNICRDTSSVLNLITCSNGEELRSKAEIAQQCQQVGIICNATNGIDCVCNPCRLICDAPLVYVGDGSCSCPSGQLLIGNNCLASYAVIIPATILGVLLLMLTIRYYIKWMVDRQDKMWHVKPSGKVG
jgi:hypothetical protein